jgi:hypothetical protein
MKEYKVSWGGKSSFSGEEIEAEDERTAYKIFLWKHRQTALSTNDKIKVEWGSGNCVYFFKEEHAEVIENLDQSQIEDALQAPQRERERKEREAEEGAKRKAAAAFAIMEKLKGNLFRSLIPSELALLLETVESALQRPNELYEWEMELVQVSLLDDATYRFLTLRESALATRAFGAQTLIKQEKGKEEVLKALGDLSKQLADISSKAGVIQKGSMVAGMAAAKSIGEGMSDSIGGG